MQQLEVFTGTDRFVLQRLLGRGTFGVVYEVYDKKNKSVIALKKLRKTVYENSSEALYRFKQEFRSLADIVHPNLVTLYELFSENENWFFTMEQVNGKDLINYIHGSESCSYNSLATNQKASQKTIQDETNSETIPDNPLLEHQSKEPKNNSEGLSNTKTISLETILKLRNSLYQLAEGIYALHKAGKLHRDLKPSNVLVTPEGRVVILDFGLVIELSVEQLEMDLVGTPNYMSPEQAAGMTVTPASDWYSFGVILYQALTTKLPFQGRVYAVLNQKQIYDAPSPKEIIENLPTDLCELCEALLRREPESRPSGEEILVCLQNKVSDSPNAHISFSKDVFIGRETHLRCLEEAFLSTKAGTPTIVCVSGISGMGKTSLVKHFLKEIHLQNLNDCLIFSGRCYEQESVPYKVFDSLVDSLTQYLKHLPEFQLLRILPSSFLALTRLFPVLKSVTTQELIKKRNAEIPNNQELRRKAFNALRELLSELAKKKTLVMFVDDLQWGDKDSAALLEEILSPPNPPPILFIGTYRSEDTKSSIFLQSLLTLPNNNSVNFKFLEVNKLSDEESRSLTLALLGGNEEILSVFADTIAEESTGIPFFINELVRHIPTHLANKVTKTGNLLSSGHLGSKTKDNNLETSLDKAIYERILELPISSRKLLETIAVAGQPIYREVAKRVAGLGQEELSAITHLRSQHLIRFCESIKDEGEIEVYHDRIRKTTINHLSADSKKDYHGKLALELELISDIDPETLVVHFLQAGNVEKTSQYAFAAGERASQTLAFERAVHFYQVCLNLHSETQIKFKELHIKLANVLASAGRSAEAANMFLLASENCEAEEWLDLQRRAGEQYLVAGLIEEGLSIFSAIINVLGMTMPKTPREALETVMALQKDISAHGLKIQETSEEKLSKNDLLQIDTCWSIVIGLTFIDTIKASAFQAKQLQLALQLGEPYRLSRAISMEIGHSSAIGLASQNKISELVNFSEKVLEKVSNPHALGLYKLVLATKAYFYGEWKAICPMTLEAEKIFREQCTNVPWEIDATNLYSFRALYFLGEIKAIAERHTIILKEAQERGNLWVAALLQSRFYIVCLAEDNPKEAQGQLNQSLQNWSKESFYMQHYWIMFGNAEVALYCQDGEKAWELISGSWVRLQQSMLLRVQVFLLESLYLHAKSAIAMALKNQEQEKFLLIAENDAKEIEKQNASWALPFISLIYASIATINDNIPKAIALLAKAESDLEAVDMRLYSNSARYLRSQLMEGQEGVILKEKAINWMMAQNIKNPSRIANMLIPGKFSR